MTQAQAINTPAENTVTLKCVCFKELYNSGNGYQVALYGTLPDRRSITAVGTILPVLPGVVCDLTGVWESSKKYGRQLRVIRYVEHKPTKPERVVDWLVSARLPGVGSAIANAMVKRFGESVYDVIKNDPDRLTKIRGINTENAREIYQAFIAKESMKDLYEYLDELGIPTTKAKAVFERFKGEKGFVETLRKHPYRMCRCKSVPFPLVDRCVMATPGGNPMDQERLEQGVLNTLARANEGGHVFLFPNQLLQQAAKTLQVDEEELKHTIVNLCRRRWMLYRNGACYLPGAYIAESDSAERLAMLVKANVDVPSKAVYTRAVEDSMREKGIKLDVNQVNGIYSVFEHPVSIITGGPGRGKTTMINVLIDSFLRVKKDARVQLCAPTGRAARKMTESCKMDAVTIHHLLGLRGEDDRGGVTKVNADILIIDEMSMCDMFLFLHIMEAVTPGIRLVFIGDDHQLPSVQAGRVFEDLIRSDVIPITRLEKIYRQSEGSSIIYNAERINNGQYPLAYDSDTVFAAADTPELVAEFVRQAVVFYSQEFPLSSIQVLSPYKRSGDICSNSLNRLLQDTFNPPSPDKEQLVVGKSIWRLGDRVIHLKNEDEVSNGDVGVITEVVSVGQDRHVSVKFETGYSYTYHVEDLFEKVTHAFALTVHKSQGSEYPVVIIPFTSEFKNMRQRNLLYTAMTRASKKVVIIGEESSIDFAAKNRSQGVRNSYFAVRLRKNFNK